MDNFDTYRLRPIGFVRSELKLRKNAPRQPGEGAPEAWIEIAPEFRDALDGIECGETVIILTWLHEADRAVLKVHSRNELDRPLRGVFATRSPDRPNPIGLHEVAVAEIDRTKGIRVAALEAIDGTPVVDIKPRRC